MGSEQKPGTAAAEAPVAAAARAVDAFALGAHLVTPRFGYTHHGIYVGNDRVIHYAGLSRSLWRGPVEEVSLEEFSGGRPVRARPNLQRRYRAAQIVARARSRLGEDAYRLTSNNCEHFCAWCISGVGRSEQIEAIAGWLRRTRDAALALCLDVVGAGRNPRAITAER